MRHDYKAEFEWGPHLLEDGWKLGEETDEQYVRRIFKQYRYDLNDFVEQWRHRWTTERHINHGLETRATFIHARVWPLELPTGVVLGTTGWDLTLRGNLHIRAEGSKEDIRADLDTIFRAACSLCKITAEL